jgi:hypothetical protein
MGVQRMSGSGPGKCPGEYSGGVRAAVQALDATEEDGGGGSAELSCVSRRADELVLGGIHN